MSRRRSATRVGLTVVGVAVAACIMLKSAISSETGPRADPPRFPTYEYAPRNFLHPYVYAPQQFGLRVTSDSQPGKPGKEVRSPADTVMPIEYHPDTRPIYYSHRFLTDVF